MGLFSYAIGRRSGAKKAAREAALEWADERDFEDEECESCGFRRRQHSDSGQCPRYD
jgi:hypothetical protein